MNRSKIFKTGTSSIAGKVWSCLGSNLDRQDNNPTHVTQGLYVLTARYIIKYYLITYITGSLFKIKVRMPLL